MPAGFSPVSNSTSSAPVFTTVGREEELRLVGRDVGGGRGGGEVLVGRVEPEDPVRILHRAGAGEQRRHLETAEPEAVEPGGRRAEHLGGGEGAGRGQRQRGGAEHERAPVDGDSCFGHDALPLFTVSFTSYGAGAARDRSNTQM